MDSNAGNLSEFGSTFDSLMRYVNRRFHVVKEDPHECPEDRLVRYSLVERYLWEHRDITEAFVRDNPDHLSPASLQTATDLAGSLYADIYLERIEGDCAIVLHMTGAYRAVIANRPAFAHLGDTPLVLRGALVPYRDAIVIIPPVLVLEQAKATDIDELHTRLEREGIATPTSDARVLVERTRAWMEQKRQAEEANRRPLDRLGPGFHRGALADLSPQQRRRVLDAHERQTTMLSGQFDAILDTLCFDVDRFPLTLEEALALLGTDWIGDIAITLADTSVPPALSGRQLTHWIRSFLAAHPETFSCALMWSLSEQFDLVDKLLDTNPLCLDDPSAPEIQHLYPMIPYVYFLREDGKALAWMPPEVRSLISRSDFEQIRAQRARMEKVRRIACGYATMCGIIRVSDVYERYRRLVSDPLDRRQFEEALDEMQDCETRDDYALWRHLSTDYLISVEISDESAPARVTRECFADRILDDDAAGTSDDPICVGLSVEDEAHFSKRVRQKQDELERLRLSLLALDRPLPPHDLPPAMMHERPVDALTQLEPLEAIRAFVDAHIPDGQDDFSFADLFCRSVVVSAVLMHESYNDTIGLIRLYGMEHCDGSSFSDNLGRLVTNAYNALPRWTHNGWSLEECTEQLTGRRRFYNPDGTVRVIGDNEPCPCGSGKVYGRCCGHLT